MGQIKDTNVIKTPEVSVSPAFFLPDGVMDISRKEGERNVTSQTTITVDLDGDDLPDIPSDGSDGVPGEETLGRLNVPSWLKIVSQDVGVTPEGNTIVDVTFEVEDVLGATSYEMRLSKP